MAFPFSYDTFPVIEQIADLSMAGPVDYAILQSMLNNTRDQICTCSSDAVAITNTKLDVVEGGIRQLVAEVIDEVNENQTISESNGMIFKIVI